MNENEKEMKENEFHLAYYKICKKDLLIYTKELIKNNNIPSARPIYISDESINDYVIPIIFKLFEINENTHKLKTINEKSSTNLDNEHRNLNLNELELKEFDESKESTNNNSEIVLVINNI